MFLLYLFILCSVCFILMFPNPTGMQELETVNETPNMPTYASVIRIHFKIVTVVVLFWNFVPSSLFAKLTHCLINL